MSIKREINDFEFQSLTNLDSEIIKNGFYDFNYSLDKDESVDTWVNNGETLEEITDNYDEDPFSLREILSLLIEFKTSFSSDVKHIFEAKNVDQVTSYYQENPFLVSIIDVMYKNIDSGFDYEGFIKELVELCEIIADVLDK